MNKESVILAFPTEETNYEQKWASPGMDLRDYFAAKAMEALIACAPNNGDIPHRTAAIEAYRYANAMLEERK